MTATAKWAIAIVIVLILGGAWWYYSNKEGPSAGMYQPSASSQSNGGTLPTSPSDTSDQAMTQDTAAIDAQMNGLNSDSANVDSSLNDQPVQQ